MSNRFSPKNPVVRLCIQAIALEDAGNPEEALTKFQEAWQSADNNFEQFIAAYHLAHRQETSEDKVKWLETALQHALSVDDEDVYSAYPTLYQELAVLYEELNDVQQGNDYGKKTAAAQARPLETGPFYHGTKADLKVGDLLTPGGQSNYQADLTMNHIYFTANPEGAGLAAMLAKGEGHDRVYQVKPTGDFEHDPNVTNQKFPGNLTRSYRSIQPLEVIGEIVDWAKQSQLDQAEWQAKLDNNHGEIIN